MVEKLLRNPQLQPKEAKNKTIYSHFMGLQTSFVQEVNEDEMNKAMDEAEQSFEAWKKLKNELKEALDKSQKK